MTFKPKFDQEILKYIQEKIYNSFIIYVDANDNGVSKIEGKEVAGVPTTLWGRVAKLNPMWWEEGADDYQQFIKAMEIVDEELVS